MGIWVGVDNSNNTSVMLTHGGVKHARSVRRLPDSDKYDTLLQTGRGKPWCEGADEAGKGADANGGPNIIPMPEWTEQKEKNETKQPISRRIVIMARHLRKYGLTDGCRGCP